MSIAYTYDRFSNRSSMTVTSDDENYTTIYVYDAANRLITETKSYEFSDEITSYYYDLNGNQVSKAKEYLVDEEGPGEADYELIAGLEETELYGYNGLNQLVEVWKDEETYTYAYNTSGIRVSKDDGTTETKFVLDAGNVIAELQNGTITANYVRGMNLIYAEIDGSTCYYLYNAHGDVTDLTTTTGAVVKSYDYDAFGNEKTPTANDTNPFRYCGEYWDDETGTYYLRARYYNPSIGRFSQQDPILDGLNWYAYCANSPVRFCDPTGLWMAGDEDRSEAAQFATYELGLLWQAANAAYKAAKSSEEKAYYRALMDMYHARANSVRESDKTGAVHLTYNGRVVQAFYQGNQFELCWAYSQAMYEATVYGKWMTQAQADQRALALGGWENQAGYPTNAGVIGDLSDPTSIYAPMLMLLDNFSEWEKALRNGPIYAVFEGPRNSHSMLIVDAYLDAGGNLRIQYLDPGNPTLGLMDADYDGFSSFQTPDRGEFRFTGYLVPTY